MPKIKRIVWGFLLLAAMASLSSCGTQKAATRTHDRGGCNCGF